MLSDVAGTEGYHPQKTLESLTVEAQPLPFGDAFETLLRVMKKEECY